MNKKLIFYTVALTAGLLTACSSDDDQMPANTIRHISVEVSQRPMTTDEVAEEHNPSSRAAITTTETFSAFSMCGVYDGAKSDYSALKSEGTWTVSPDTWPVSDNSSVSFYAFTGGTFYANDGTPYVSFTVAENASTQHDLLVVTNSVAYNDHGGKVPLTFDHACAAVAFNVQISNTLKTQLGTTLTVNSIVLRNVNNTGRYDFGTSAWENVSGSAYYTLTNSSITIDTKAQALSSNHLFMIPQIREANGTTGTYLEVNYSFSGQTQTSATIPLAIYWKAGYEYTINIKLGTTLIK